MSPLREGAEKPEGLIIVLFLKYVNNTCTSNSNTGNSQEAKKKKEMKEVLIKHLSASSST